MALSIGHQVSSTDTSITLAVAQGTLPGNFLEDRFYAVDEYTTSEPARTPDATLTTGGNTQVTLTGLSPDRNYWIVAFRRFNDATPAQQATGPVDEAYNSYYQSDYQTTADSALYAPPAGNTWVEDWTAGFTRWIDEYPVFNEDAVHILPDDGAMGSRFYKSQQTFSPLDPFVIHSAQKWDWKQPLDVSAKVRIQHGSDGVAAGGFGVQTGEYSYCTIAKWTASSTIQVYNNDDLGGQPNQFTTYPVQVGVVQTWRITFDGTNTWRQYVDGTLINTFTWTPKAPLGLWLGLYNDSCIGQITVTGTPFVYGSNCGMDLFARWSGNFSCKEDREQELNGFGSDYGGLTGPNVNGTHKTSNGSEGVAATQFAAGSWNARSPKFRGVKRLRFAGRQTNGSMTIAVKRASDDVTLVTLTPTGSTETTWDVPVASQWDPLYLQVTGSTTAQGYATSVLHYIAAESAGAIQTVGQSWSLPYTVRQLVARSWAMPYLVVDSTPKTWPTLRRLQPGIVTATWPTRRRLRDPSQLQPAAVDSPTLVADPLADRVLIGVSE